MLFSYRSGREPNLKYITEEDIASGDVKIVPEGERNQGGAEDLVDAEDLMVLRRRADPSGEIDTEGSLSTKKKQTEQPLLIMDGLVRREVSFPSVPESLTFDVIGKSPKMSQSGEGEVLESDRRAYVVGSRSLASFY